MIRVYSSERKAADKREAQGQKQCGERVVTASARRPPGFSHVFAMASASKSAPDDPPLPDWLRSALDEATRPVASSETTVPKAFMAVWGGFCAVSLFAGAAVGYRGFEDTAAFEALEKMEKPTPQSEAMASRYAVRAFGWGTALAVGSAAAATLAVRATGITSASEFGAQARVVLTPFDAWLRRQGDWLIGTGESAGRALDGALDGAANLWHGSWLAGAMRTRVERVAEHHEQLDRTVQGGASEKG